MLELVKDIEKICYNCIPYVQKSKQIETKIDSI